MNGKPGKNNEELKAAAPARPFVKWVGGKRQILPYLIQNLPEKVGTYFEPFAGGAALFFASQFPKAVLADINPELVCAWNTIRDDCPGLIKALKKMPYDHDFYYEVRAQNPAELSDLQKTARFIYLNKCGFNGLYRVNSKGQFNVPFGRHKNPQICDEQNLQAVSQKLQKTKVLNTDFENAVAKAKAGDFVYFDPPYVPLSPSANFTQYSKQGFGLPEQERLAQVFGQLSKRGVNCLLSNSETTIVRKLYKGFKIVSVSALRNVNCDGKKRGPVQELLIKNF